MANVNQSPARNQKKDNYSTVYIMFTIVQLDIFATMDILLHKLLIKLLAFRAFNP